MSRQGNNWRTNLDFERLGFVIADLEERARTSTSQEQSTSNSLSIAEPALPFKLSERVDEEGKLFVLVRVNIPPETETLRILLIRKSLNAVQSDESTSAAKKRAQSQVEAFRIEISEDEQEQGFVERELAIKPKKKQNDGQYQLIRLIGLDDKGAKAKNPENNPFTSELFPFPALKVRTDGATEDDNFYFNIGSALASTPSKPDPSLIVCNRPYTDTTASDASLSFKVIADAADNTKTFEQVSADEIIVVLKRVGDLDARRIRWPIVDRSESFALVNDILPLGSSWTWEKNILKNSSGESISADASVVFTAGGSRSFQNLVAFSNLPEGFVGNAASGQIPANVLILRVERQANDFSLLTAKWQQPSVGANPCDPSAQPVVFKRIRFLKRRSDGTYRLINKQGLLDQEEFLMPGVKEVTYEAKTKNNETNIFRVELVGVGNPAPKIVVDLGGSSALSTKPSTPTAADIVENLPDGDTSEPDAKLVFRIYPSQEARTNPAITWRSLGVDSVGVVIQKKRASGQSSQGDDVQGREIVVTRPLLEEELDLNLAFLRVVSLKLAKRYLYRGNLAGSNGSFIRSLDPGAEQIAFIAGFGGAAVTSLANWTFSISRVDKNHSEVVTTFQQPAPPNQPVLLKNARLFMRRPPKLSISYSAASPNSINDLGASLGSNGTFTDTSSAIYTIRCVSSTQFTWQKGNGLVNGPFTIFAGSSYSLSDNLQISFANSTGHFSNDQWVITANRTKFKEVARLVLRDIKEINDNTFVMQPATDTQTKILEATIQHPQKTRGIEYYWEIRAVGDDLLYVPPLPTGSVTSPVIFVDGDTGADEPLTPATPNSNDVVSTLNGDTTAADTKTTVTVYATENRTGTFAQANATRAGVIIADPADTTDNGRKDVSIDITDPNQTSTKIDILDLSLGKSFLIKRAFTANSNATSRSALANVSFTAGGRRPSAGIAELSPPFTFAPPRLKVLPVDDRTSNLELEFYQPSSPVLLRRVDWAKKRANELDYTEFSNTRLLDKESYQLPSNSGSSSYTGDVKRVTTQVTHKKNTPMNYRATIVGFGGVSREVFANATSDDDAGGFVDIGVPLYSGINPNAKLKWRNQGFIEFSFKLPNQNMKTHITNKIEVVIITLTTPFVTQYFWNVRFDPLSSPSSYTTSTPPFFTSDYYVDVGKGTQIIFGAVKPTPTSSGDLPTQIWNQLTMFGGYMVATAYIQNAFSTDPANSAGSCSDQINWPF